MQPSNDQFEQRASPRLEKSLEYGLWIAHTLFPRRNAAVTMVGPHKWSQRRTMNFFKRT